MAPGILRALKDNDLYTGVVLLELPQGDRSGFDDDPPPCEMLCQVL